MSSRNELAVRSRAVGLDPSTYTNDSKLEQKVLWLEKRATTFTGTLATGTLTSDATLQATGDQVTIGDITYTFRTALTGTKATQTLTSDATAPSDGDTATVEGTTYVFRTALTNTVGAPYEVLIGVSAAVALDNLKSAINVDGTAGVYGAGTLVHPLVTATTNTNTTQVVQAKSAGTAANQYLVSETSSHLSWGATTLTGGLATIPNEVLLGADAATMLDNLKIAINAAGGTEGTEYSFGTIANPQVTATTNTNTTQVVQAVDYSVTNASVVTTDPTDTGSHMSWGAATLASGVAKQVALDSTTVNGSAGLSGDKNV